MNHTATRTKTKSHAHSGAGVVKTVVPPGDLGPDRFVVDIRLCAFDEVQFARGWHQQRETWLSDPATSQNVFILTLLTSVMPYNTLKNQGGRTPLLFKMVLTAILQTLPLERYRPSLQLLRTW